MLFVGDGPDGFAELRFRPSLYTGAPDAYLEELYVASEADPAALALYERAGFTNREGAPDGPKMLYFERDL